MPQLTKMCWALKIVALVVIKILFPKELPRETQTTFPIGFKKHV